jgi:hypothetical protein
MLQAILTVLLTGLVLSVINGPLSAENKRKETTPVAPSLQIGNETGKILSLSSKDWEKLPRRQIEVKDRDGSTSRYEGVSWSKSCDSRACPLISTCGGRASRITF